MRSVRTPIGIAALSAALVFALMVALRPITPRIAFNDGLGPLAVLAFGSGLLT